MRSSPLRLAPTAALAACASTGTRGGASIVDDMSVECARLRVPQPREHTP